MFWIIRNSDTIDMRHHYNSRLTCWPGRGTGGIPPVAPFLTPGVIVEKDALVEDSVIFDDVVIEPGAEVKHAIIDKEAIIRSGTHIGYNPEADRRRGCTISERGVVVVPKGMDISLT